MRTSLLRSVGRAVSVLSLASAGLALTMAPSIALAQDPHGTPRPGGGASAMRPMPMPPSMRQAPPGGDPHAAPHGSAPAHGAAPGGHDDHGKSGHDAASGGHGGHHELEEINWFYGLLGEKEGASDHDIFWRPKGKPIPLIANFINFAILAGAGVYFGRKPLAESLVKRRNDLEREMDEAAKVMDTAEKRLAEYRAKLDGIDAEIARLRADYAEQTKREKERVLREAVEKRERMRRDSEFLIEQEGKLIKAALLRQTVDAATGQAETMIRKSLTAQDQERLAEEFLKGMTAASTGGAR
ncbi:MAG: ATP synthase F0 subunit B, partial [Polyangiaceae bacterium]